MGDIGGNGVLELIPLGAGMRLVNATMGTIEWTFPGVGGTIEPITADINSDGQDEFIVVANNTLTTVVCHGNDGGKILWKKSFPANIGAPSLPK